MLLRMGTILLFILLSSHCTASRPGPTSPDAQVWNGVVRVDGALRAMFHEGQIGAAVGLDALLPNPNLYAVGALESLAGEVTIVWGVAYLSYPTGPGQTRTERATRATSGAALLVSAVVQAWESVRTTRAIGFEELDAEVGRLAVAAGARIDQRVPFLVEGELEDLRWHVVDGRRLAEGGASHKDHLAASVQLKEKRATAILVGFYSQTDQGVFTHIGARSHIHCVLQEPLSSGHVDHVMVPAGAIWRFPTTANRRPGDPHTGGAS